MYSTKLQSVLAILTTLSIISGSWAQNCQVETKTYTAGDGLVLVSAGYVISFSAKCPPNVQPTYAKLNNQLLALVQQSDGKSYQLSWTEDLLKATSGSYNIEIYDESGYQQLRKQHAESVGNVRPLFTIPFSHGSPFKGPLVRSEFAALFIFLICTYQALVLRFKILSKKI